MKTLRILIYTLFLFAVSELSEACTTFILEDQNTLVFGRNLDWVSDEGLIVVNKKGVKKTAFVPLSKNRAVWVSKYGSVTFNQFGKELPYGGMNEKGLVIEIMRSEADYSGVDARPEINESQWIQYQLDQFKTVEEVLASDKLVRIKGLREELHYLICDREGNKAVIEFSDGKMKVVKNMDIPVLENQNYKESLTLFQANKECRFSTVANRIADYKKSSNKNPIDYSFKILKEVALQGSWSIVYDIKNMQIHFRSETHKEIKSIDLNAFNFDCKHSAEIIDINTALKGNVTEHFTPYSETKNTEIVKKAIKSNRLAWPKAITDELLNYANTCFCVWR